MNCEKNISTTQKKPLKNAWISEKNEHKGGKGCPEEEKKEGEKEIIRPNTNKVNQSAKTLKKFEILRGRKNFRYVLSRGIKKDQSGLTIIFYRNNLNVKRIGVIFKKDFVGAVKRNRIKRIIKEIFRQNKSLFPESRDVIFIVRKELVKADFALLSCIILNCMMEKQP